MTIAVDGARPRLSPIARARYRASQSARVAWYAAHYALARRLVGGTVAKEETDPPKSSDTQQSGASVRRAMRDSMAALFKQDMANIAEGFYPRPRDFNPARLLSTLRKSQLYFADLPDVDRRRRTPKGGVEARDIAPSALYPNYYRQNFHFQTDGWMSRDSARLYDTQVEVLFGGAADAMRRAALAMLAREIRGRDQRQVSVVDVACGTGRFLEQMLDAFPRLPALGLDLSQAYLEEAEERLSRWPQARVRVANAESTGEASGAYDVVTCVYLFHELPPRIRAIVASELARITKPGGLVVVADSLQIGDTPELDPLLGSFPQMFHEPYYSTYVHEDLTALFRDAGLEPEDQTIAFLTKVTAWRKPG